jgi:predicted small lipoprotein YifL
MRMLRPLLASSPLMLAMLLSACGNKGDLVKPTPSTLPPPTQQPAASDTTPPAQDDGGH